MLQPRDPTLQTTWRCGFLAVFGLRLLSPGLRSVNKATQDEKPAPGKRSGPPGPMRRKKLQRPDVW
eukprot:2866507-Pyramimonas_sp.AAC.1